MRFASLIMMSLVSLILLNVAQAEEPPVAIRDHGFLLGHNLTATSDVLEGESCSIGIQVLGCRVASGTIVGTSPWMYFGFRMWNIALRHLIAEDLNGNRWAVQTTYFETFDHSNNQSWSPYDMRAFWLQGIRTLAIEPWYRLHLNVATNYYFSDRKPFSLRRPAVESNKTQINISSLNQFISHSGWMALAEFGFLDLFRAPLHTHAGVSLGFDGSWYSWHLGLSVSTSLRTLFNPSEGVDYQSKLLGGKDANGLRTGNGYEGAIDSSLADRDYGFHPEFALQATF